MKPAALWVAVLLAGCTWLEQSREDGGEADLPNRDMATDGGANGDTPTHDGGPSDRVVGSKLWTDLTPCPRPSSTPSARHGHVMVLDEARGKVVLFGGYERPDVWEWDQDKKTWTDRTPCVLPASWPRARSLAGMTYDRARSKIVLFGGVQQEMETAPLADIWEWDGATGVWTDRTPSPLPAKWPTARRKPLLASDGHGHVVLLGGDRPEATMIFQDLWRWDGATGSFEDLTPATLPDPWPVIATPHTMVFDSARNRIVLQAGPYSTETWEWDGEKSTWLNRTTGVQPPHGLAVYDSDRNRTFLRADGTTVWEYDGTVEPAIWTKRKSTGNPPGIDEFAWASAGAGRAILFGGREAGVTWGQTWEWKASSSSWSDIGPAATGWPETRLAAGLEIDSSRNKAILILSGNAFPKAQTWEYDLAAKTWANRSAPPPAESIGEQYAWAHAYDAASHRVIFYGGFNLSIPGGVVAEWNGEAGEWAFFGALDPRPAGRFGAAMAYDPGTESVVMYGGVGMPGTKVSSELWQWNGKTKTWTSRTSGVAPPEWPGPHRDHTLSFDPISGHILMFGGQGDELWELDTSTWRWNGIVKKGVWPPARGGHGAVVDPARHQLTIFGGTGGTGVRNDVWELDLDTRTWSNCTPAMLPAAWPVARESFGFAANPAGGALLFGGKTDAWTFWDLWQWSGPN